jgi:hypothetical protein
VSRFFAALVKEPELMQGYWKLALCTGTRKGNLQLMEFSDVHLDRQEWLIPLTKNGKPEVAMVRFHDCWPAREAGGLGLQRWNAHSNCHYRQHRSPVCHDVETIAQSARRNFELVAKLLSLMRFTA